MHSKIPKILSEMDYSHYRFLEEGRKYYHKIEGTDKCNTAEIINIYGGEAVSITFKLQEDDVIYYNDDDGVLKAVNAGDLIENDGANSVQKVFNETTGCFEYICETGMYIMDGVAYFTFWFDFIDANGEEQSSCLYFDANDASETVGV